MAINREILNIGSISTPHIDKQPKTPNDTDKIENIDINTASMWWINKRHINPIQNIVIQSNKKYNQN